MTGIIYEPMTFTCITVNVRSSIKTILLVSNSPEKKTLSASNPTPLEIIASSWTPFPLEFLMPSIGGGGGGGVSINHILKWRVRVSIVSRTHAGVHVIVPGSVTASFSLNVLNSYSLIFCRH